MVELAALDIAVMAAYFVVIIGLGFWVGRGERDALDYFLAARALPWLCFLKIPSAAENLVFWR